MLRTFLAITAVCLAPAAPAGQFLSGISIIAAAQVAPAPAPQPDPDSDECSNCNGTGKLGDGTVSVTCPVCDGTGKKQSGGVATVTGKDAPPAINPALLKAAGEQPTPMIGVAAALKTLNPQPDEMLVDYGCGFDARFLITAARLYGVKQAVGVEIDPDTAESARRYVEHAGLSDRIKIITGDSTKLEIKADIGVAYMWADTLKQLKPQIEKLDRFVCYGFAVPGLAMKESTAPNGGKVYAWQAVTRVPVTRSVRQIVRLPRGSYCQVCGRNCSNPMAHHLQQQIVGYRDVPSATQQQPAKQSGYWTRKKVCYGTHCEYKNVWVPAR